MLALGRPKTRHIGGQLIEVSCNTTLVHGTIGFMGLGCLAAASVFCALETCWRWRSALNASAARSFAVFKLAMRAVAQASWARCLFLRFSCGYLFHINFAKTPINYHYFCAISFVRDKYLRVAMSH
jgi:hypothetical protein